jgi:S-adenosylmethionine decarboxylase proenzyme
LTGKSYDAIKEEGLVWLKALGQHLLIELYGCEPGVLDDLEHVQQTMLRAADMVSASIIQVVSHKFQPHGVTVVVAISESHLSVHTWPEYGYAAVDVFTCSPEPLGTDVQDFLIQSLRASDATSVELKRGILAGRLAGAAAVP